MLLGKVDRNKDSDKHRPGQDQNSQEGLGGGPVSSFGLQAQPETDPTQRERIGHEHQNPRRTGQQPKRCFLRRGIMQTGQHHRQVGDHDQRYGPAKLPFQSQEMARQHLLDL